MRVLIVFLLLCATALAQPTPVINGPKDARPGDIVLLDASGSGATHYVWAVDLSGVEVPADGGVNLSLLPMCYGNRASRSRNRRPTTADRRIWCSARPATGCNCRPIPASTA